jgi:hypothetical protein
MISVKSVEPTEKRAVGQICLRMNDDPNGVFELVLAEDPNYRKKIDELQIALAFSAKFCLFSFWFCGKVIPELLLSF